MCLFDSADLSGRVQCENNEVGWIEAAAMHTPSRSCSSGNRMKTLLCTDVGGRDPDAQIQPSLRCSASVLKVKKKNQ